MISNPVRWLILLPAYVAAALFMPLLVFKGLNQDELILAWKISFTCGAIPLIWFALMELMIKRKGD